jgi:hypothetical protein
MTFDDLLFAIIIAGLGLSGAYLRAELLSHRRLTAAQRKSELLHLELHTNRVRLEKNGVSTPPRAAPTSIPNDFQTARVLARALRILVQEHDIHRFWRRTQA